jgi:hypothetical protein
VCRLQADELGHRYLLVEQANGAAGAGRINVSIHPSYLEVEEIDVAVPGRRQQRLDLRGRP